MGPGGAILESEEITPVEARMHIEKWFERFNAHDAAGLAALHAEDCEHESPKLRVVHKETGGVLRGREAMQGWEQKAFDTIAGLRYALKGMMIDGNRVVAFYTRHADGQSDLPVAEYYELVKISGEVRIKVSRVLQG